MAAPDQLTPITAVSHPWRRRWFGTRAYWLAQSGGWGGFVVLDSLTLFTPVPAGTRWSDTVEALSIAGLGLLVTHLLRVLILAARRRRRSWPALAVRLVPAWFAAGAGMAGPLSYGNIAWFHHEDFVAGTLVRGDGWYEYLSLLSFSLFFTGIWMALYFGYHYYSQFRMEAIERLRLESEVREAELRALKAQINPHFLFNALNTVRALTPREFTAPRQAVTSISELLRAALSLEHVGLIALAREIEVVGHYLALEQLRLESRLTVERHIDPATLDWEVPPLAVQSLVENAIKHGIAPRASPGTIGLTACVLEDRLCITVTNPGGLHCPDTSSGLGLRNIRRRLALVFGSDASLELRQSAPDLVTARLTIPRPKGRSG